MKKKIFVTVILLFFIGYIAKHKDISGEKLYTELRKKGILVRHFTKKEIENYNRITIGTKEQMVALIRAIKDILEEEK